VIGHETIRLRPTLGAAFRLDQKYEASKICSTLLLVAVFLLLAMLIKRDAVEPQTLPHYLDAADSNEPLAVRS